MSYDPPPPPERDHPRTAAEAVVAGVPRPQLHNPEATRRRIDDIVAAAQRRIDAEQRRQATFGSRKPSRREKRATRRSS